MTGSAQPALQHDEVITSIRDEMAKRRRAKLLGQAQPELKSSQPQPYAPAAQAQRNQTADQAAQKLLRDMRLVKRARFNAHERLLSKHTASVVAFSLAAVGEIGISIYAIAYSAVVTAHTEAFLSFAGVVTAVLLLVAGLVVGLANYQPRALNLQRCAIDLADLGRELELDLPLTTPQLQDFRRRYHEIIARCPDNHSDVDIERALAKRDNVHAWNQAKRSEFLDIYGLYIVATAGYVSLWVAFWWIIQTS